VHEPVPIAENWLDSVAPFYSKSRATEQQYKRVWERFSSFMGKKADHTSGEIDTIEDRVLRLAHGIFKPTF
jgi:hypothetical protein